MDVPHLLIKNGTVVNSDSTIMNDVLIINGRIAEVGRDIIPPPQCGVIDAKGKYVIPGGIDPNTQLEVDSGGVKPKDDFYSGTRAGVAGGTTMVMDLALPRQGESPLGSFLDLKAKGEKKAVCDFSLHVGITWWSPQVAQDMAILTRQYGISSYKMFMADEYMMNDSQLYKAFKTCEMLGALPMVHAENGLIIEENITDLLGKGVTGPEGHWLSRSENIEAEATNRACVIAENVGSPLYVSPIMSESAAAMVSLWRKAGNVGIYGEVIAAGLGTTFSVNSDFDKAAAQIMCPPIRSSQSTPKALMMRLAQVDLVTVGSANCTFDRSQKEVGKHKFTMIPKGVNGLEDRMSIVWHFGVETGILSAQQFVAVTSTNAAKIFNVFPKKGCIAEGSDGDIVVWNSRVERVISARNHHHNNDINIFDGLKVKGAPEHVIVKGKLCYSNGELSTVKGRGEFVPAYSPSSHHPMKEEVVNMTATPSFPSHSQPIDQPCASIVAPVGAGDRFSEPIGVAEFSQPKSLNFQEKICAIEAMKKICSKINLTLSTIFKGYDKGNANEISKADFQVILSKTCGLSSLSNREIDAIIKGYGSANGDALKYVDFLKACEYLFCSKRLPC